MVNKKVGKKAAPKRKAAPKKKTSNNKALASGLDDTFQNWVNQQVALLNKKKR